MHKYIASSIYVTLFVVSLAGMATQIREYHTRYLHHRNEARHATIYLKTQVCQDARTKANLGDFHNCDHAAKILEISPWIAAGYDIVENWHVCGHGRCELFLQDLLTRVNSYQTAALVGLVIVLVWRYYDDRRNVRVGHYNLPVGMPYPALRTS